MSNPNRIVRDAKQWKDMAGENELEKKINSYLTTHFILERDVPANECITETHHILQLVQQHLEKQGSRT